MNHLGHIEIRDKIIFVYYEKKKPIELNYWGYGKDRGGKFYKLRYEKALKEYQASRREVEVENVIEHLIPYLNQKKVYKYYDVIFDRNNFEQIKDNQPCEAEVKNDKATIVKIL